MRKALLHALVLLIALATEGCSDNSDGGGAAIADTGKPPGAPVVGDLQGSYRL